MKPFKALPLFPFEAANENNRPASQQCQNNKPPHEAKYRQVRAVLVSNCRRQPFTKREVRSSGCGIQLCFEFYLDDVVKQFASYVPKRKNALLDREFDGLASRDGRLFKLSGRMQEVGLIKIGHVVQLSEREFTELTGASHAMVHRVRALLLSAGLDFDMKTLGWNSAPGRSR